MLFNLTSHILSFNAAIGPLVFTLLWISMTFQALQKYTARQLRFLFVNQLWDKVNKIFNTCLRKKQFYHKCGI